MGFREDGGAGARGSVAFRRPEHAAQQNMQLARDQLARAAQVAAGQLSMEDLSDDGAARRTDLVSPPGVPVRLCCCQGGDMCNTMTAAACHLLWPSPRADRMVAAPRVHTVEIVANCDSWLGQAS